jgi:hypothetical protein
MQDDLMVYELVRREIEDNIQTFESSDFGIAVRRPATTHIDYEIWGKVDTIIWFNVGDQLDDDFKRLVG